MGDRGLGASMSSIVPNYRSVQQLLKDASFSIDEYQREYKWEKKHIDALLDDLTNKFLSCYRDGDATAKVAEYEEYFLGSIIVSQRGTKRYLVDGQQRVTSLTLLLIHLYRQAIAQGLGLKSSIEPLIFSDNYGQPKFNLDIPEREPVIRALFNGDDFNPAGHDESIQTMDARYADIEEADVAGTTGAALQHFIYWLMTKVGLIEISTNNDNYAYAIFETMNDRGKPLSPVDMLKAYLLSPIADADQRKLANQGWRSEVHSLISWGDDQDGERDSACIKAWLRAQYADSTRDRRAGATDRDWELIGSVFHRWVRDNSTRMGLGTDTPNLKFMTESFPFFARAYKLILDASSHFIPGLEAVYYNAHNEFTWQSTVLLAALSPTDDDATVRRKINVTATYLDIWLMRRSANYVRIGYSSVSYAMFILCRDIRRLPLDELVRVLRQRLEDDETTFAGIKDRKDRLGIAGLGLNQFSRRYIYHMLARLTAYTDGESGRTTQFPAFVDRTIKNPFDIEHIWPDSCPPIEQFYPDRRSFENARDHIAGLLLLPADVNRSLQDKLFDAKKAVYATQNLYAASLTDEVYAHQPGFRAFRERAGLAFKPYTHFTPENHAERMELVSALVDEVWSPVRLTQAAG